MPSFPLMLKVVHLQGCFECPKAIEARWDRERRRVEVAKGGPKRDASSISRAAVPRNVSSATGAKRALSFLQLADFLAGALSAHGRFTDSPRRIARAISCPSRSTASNVHWLHPRSPNRSCSSHGRTMWSASCAVFRRGAVGSRVPRAARHLTPAARSGAQDEVRTAVHISRRGHSHGE